jgi:hypothetical protein
MKLQKHERSLELAPANSSKSLVKHLIPAQVSVLTHHAVSLAGSIANHHYTVMVLTSDTVPAHAKFLKLFPPYTSRPNNFLNCHQKGFLVVSVTARA